MKVLLSSLYILKIVLCQTIMTQQTSFVTQTSSSTTTTITSSQSSRTSTSTSGQIIFEQQQRKLQTQFSSNSDIQSFQSLNLQRSIQQVNRHNSKEDKTYELQVNQYSLLSQDEADKILFTLIPSQKATIQWAEHIIDVKQFIVSTTDSTVRPPSFVPSQTAVKNQEKENPVIDILRNFLEQKQLPQEQINTQLSEYTLSGRSSSGSTRAPIRRLQTLGASQPEGNDQQSSLQQLSKYNVDWSCIAGNVRSQGRCGACYAFAVLDAFSMILGIYQRQFFVPMSVQELLQCPKNSMTLGCAGGLLEGALTYLILEGVVIDHWYPLSQPTFETKTLGVCDRKKQNKRYKVRSFNPKLFKDCHIMRQNLLRQPMAIGISGKKLLQYKSGIFNDCDPSARIDHAVVLIGYKAGKGWKIKNTWGKKWGEDGFAWIADGNQCRICEHSFTMEPSDQDIYINYIYGLNKKKCDIQ